MSDTIKPVRYDDQAVSYGPSQPQTVEVASGVLSSLGGGIVDQVMCQGVQNAAVVAGDLVVDFVQPVPLPYIPFVTLTNVLPLPSFTLIHSITRTASGFTLKASSPGAMPVDLSTIPFLVYLSIRVAA